MAYRITYNSGETEIAPAGDYHNSGPWVVFYDKRGLGNRAILQVKAAQVKRIDHIGDDLGESDT